MTKEDISNAVSALLNKALSAPSGGDALAFAQAAGQVSSLVYTLDYGQFTTVSNPSTSPTDDEG